MHRRLIPALIAALTVSAVCTSAAEARGMRFGFGVGIGLGLAGAALAQPSLHEREMRRREIEAEEMARRKQVQRQKQAQSKAKSEAKQQAQAPAKAARGQGRRVAAKGAPVAPAAAAATPLVPAALTPIEPKADQTAAAAPVQGESPLPADAGLAMAPASGLGAFGRAGQPTGGSQLARSDNGASSCKKVVETAGVAFAERCTD